MYRALQLRFSFLLATSLLVIASASGHSAQAAEKTCCVDEDIAAAFLLHWSYSREWPDAFPFTLADDQLEFVGAATNAGHHIVSIAWKAQVTSKVALQLVGDALAAENWRQLPDASRGSLSWRRGFISRQALAVSNNQQFCRGQDGLMSIQARDSDIGTVVSLTNQPIYNGKDCSDHLESQRQDPYDSTLTKYLPMLEMPENAPLPNGGSGTGGSSNDAHADILVKTDISESELIRFFEAQMIDQQWQLNSRFSGDSFSGSVWQRQIDGRTLSCLVTAQGARRGIKLRMQLDAL